ncbi:hypothetical protein JHK85_006594 [Glycine max]|nr:hypothetical protein JHK85_006594 [Glycine max]KAG5071199.1 hypothetical protein JHK86_006410 [Glycine max]
MPSPSLTDRGDANAGKNGMPSPSPLMPSPSLTDRGDSFWLSRRCQLISSLLLVISFYWLFLCNHVFVVSGLCLDDQRSLLLQFKNNLTFTNMAEFMESK